MRLRETVLRPRPELGRFIASILLCRLYDYNSIHEAKRIFHDLRARHCEHPADGGCGGVPIHVEKEKWRILPVGEVHDQPAALAGGHRRHAPRESGPASRSEPY